MTLTTQQYKNLILSQDDMMGVITINRPQVMNALDDATIAELSQAVDQMDRDPSIRVIVLTGGGEKSFIAGADITELRKVTPLEGVAKSERGHALLLKLESIGKPVIAAINGYALGGGCELAMACDIRIASEKAKFGQPEVNLGIIPGYGGTQRLPRLVGKGRALELIMTGDSVDAEEAYRIGLVNKVVPPEKLMSTCKEMAANIAEKGPAAIALAKKAVHVGMSMGLEDGCRYELLQFGVCCATEDKQEGLSAFLQKRKPDFKGR
ncbi:MAG: enoyl-CoA hydratase/isomerase family protein [Armatimonadetes bacterium]|nr:enoyl-CoA hydratase/isomerase family protein [Armatimonadota bacterium]